MKRNILLLTLSVGIFLFVSFSSSGLAVSAENNEVDALKQKITRLENRIKDLESLLKISHITAGQDTYKKYGWLNKKTWRSLKKGMTEDEVRKMLGEPVKTVEGFRTIWYYPNFYSGIVSFDKKGNLIGWNAP